MLCWYDNVCLMNNDNVNNLIIDVCVVHLHKHAHETLPVRACNAIWHRNTWSYANSVELSQSHVDGLPGNLGWHDRRRSARMRIQSDVSICTIEIGWHDRRGQHKGVLDRMCLNAPIQNYELLRLNRAAWKMRSAGLRCQGCNAIVMGCWGRHVKSNVSICTMEIG